MATTHDERQRARQRAFPWLFLERRKPDESDAPAPSALPGKQPKVYPAQLTITQARGYDPAA